MGDSEPNAAGTAVAGRRTITATRTRGTRSDAATAEKGAGKAKETESAAARAPKLRSRPKKSAGSPAGSSKAVDEESAQTARAPTAKKGGGGEPRKVGRPKGPVPPPKSNPAADTDDGLTADEAPDDGRQYWLMKAEPESRVEKGVDVKFSIDDLMEKDVEGWDGQRLPSSLPCLLPNNPISFAPAMNENVIS